MFEDIAKKILAENYYAVGVRALCDDENYSVGDICRNSYEWDFENDCSAYYTTGERANGTCATHIRTHDLFEDDVKELAKRIEKAIEKNRVYGSRQVLIAGDRVNNDGAFDDGEVRIIDAVVIAVL